MFREERKKEIHQNMANIIEGKREKAQKELEEKKSRGEVSEDAKVKEDFSVDVDKVPIPAVPKKFSLVQLYTGVH
jgi:hypothetical protein